MIGIGQKDCFLGQDDHQKRGILCLNKIIERGIVIDFHKYEKLLHHVFYAGLRRAPEDHPVIYYKFQ
jgi:actin beta/gamma 1